MTKQVRMLKLSNQDIIMVTISKEDDEFFYVDDPALVFAEMDEQTKNTKISYVPWMPFYGNQKGIAISKMHVVVGSKEEVNAELADRYSKMVNPSQIIMPNKTGLVGV